MDLFENWSETKTALMDGLSKRKQDILSPILETQRKYMTETAAGDITNSTAIGNFQKIMIPMIRRIIPGTIATEVVGVQPMSGPVGLAYSLRFVFSQGLNTGDARTDIVAGNEVFGNNSKTKRFYTGGMTAGADGTFFTADDVATGTGAPTDLFESWGGRNLQLEVLKQTVTAQTRRLQAKWSIEAMQDLSSQHGLDLEAEITGALSSEIVSEIDNEIITDLIALAGTVESYDMNGSFTGVPHYVGDRHAVLGVLVNKVCNEIARKTRRGAGNYVIVSPLVVSVLQSASKSVFAPAIAGSFEGPNNTKMVGTLNGTIKVYSYLYHDQGTESILIGYKGGNGETDVGYFYCPYIPLMSSNVITDPQTYNNQISLMTRYGKATFVNSSTSLANSADYYGKISVANLTFM
jgi:hypothetical protein